LSRTGVLLLIRVVLGRIQRFTVPSLTPNRLNGSAAPAYGGAPPERPCSTTETTYALPGECYTHKRKWRIPTWWRTYVPSGSEVGPRRQTPPRWRGCPGDEFKSHRLPTNEMAQLNTFCARHFATKSVLRGSTETEEWSPRMWLSLSLSLLTEAWVYGYDAKRVNEWRAGGATYVGGESGRIRQRTPGFPARSRQERRSRWTTRLTHGSWGRHGHVGAWDVSDSFKCTRRASMRPSSEPRMAVGRARGGTGCGPRVRNG
jgi:hypothetical protein